MACPCLLLLVHACSVYCAGSCAVTVLRYVAASSHVITSQSAGSIISSAGCLIVCSVSSSIPDDTWIYLMSPEFTWCHLLSPCSVNFSVFFSRPLSQHRSTVLHCFALFCYVLFIFVPYSRSIVINRVSCIFMHCQSLSCIVMQSVISSHPFRHIQTVQSPVTTCSYLFTHWFTKFLLVLCIFAQSIVADASFVDFCGFL